MRSRAAAIAPRAARTASTLGSRSSAAARSCTEGSDLSSSTAATDNTAVETIALTALSHGAGCACKLPAADVHALLGDLAASADPRLLVGNDTADDAAVYQLRDDLAVVTTVDFFTPIVDDPYDFGRVAAANALSDVYAMGASPLTALNLVAWPLQSLGREPLREVLRGGADVTGEAGVAIVGGHSIDDNEPKYGLAVTGVVVGPRQVLQQGVELGRGQLAGAARAVGEGG